MQQRVKGQLLRTNRKIAWILIGSALLMVLTGYGNTRGLGDRYLLNTLHLWGIWLFTGIFVVHVVLSLGLTRYSIRTAFQRQRTTSASNLGWIRIVQRASGWVVLVLSFLVIVAGLARYQTLLAEFVSFTVHVQIEVWLIIGIILHGGMSLLVMLRRTNHFRPITTSVVGVLIASLIIITVVIDGSPLLQSTSPPTTTPTTTTETAFVVVDGEVHWFDPLQVTTVRPDLFQPDQFSMLDVLVHLDQKGAIRLITHFDTSMNTYIIDSIDGIPTWWYKTYYSGGWKETNVFRPDHYPWKNGTYLEFFQSTPEWLSSIYQEWTEEVTRRQAMNGSIIIPEVHLSGTNFTEVYYNISVTPHNLRNDVFQDNVTTAIDVILSMGDQGIITYDLQWYDSIGTAKIVRSYWVNSINGNQAYGTCGFVYEAGSHEYTFFSGNHIHLPSDTRAINNPEYVKYFWICL